VHAPYNNRVWDWSFYSGVQDTRSPATALPHWKQDDATLRIRCVPRTVNIDTRRIADESRAPLLLNIYKQVRPELISACGPQLSRRLNIDVWNIQVVCGGPCQLTYITLHLVQGQGDILMVHSAENAPFSSLCISCSNWAGRLLSNQTARWSTRMAGSRMSLYIVLVGYTDYVSLNIKIDSPNIISGNPTLYTD
jgi:hypothetical protein